MKWSLSAFLLTIASPGISGFMLSSANTHSTSVERSNGNVITKPSELIVSHNSMTMTKRNMASIETETDHDTVTVDLSDGRDYPIYIGANFDDKQGENDDALRDTI